jgi:hypothetical protein
MQWGMCGTQVTYSIHGTDVVRDVLGKSSSIVTITVQYIRIRMTETPIYSSPYID